MTGTIRTFEPEVLTRVLQRFEETVHGVAEAMGCRATIDLERLTPATVNQPETALSVQTTTRQLFPDAKIESGNYLTMGSEDFAFLLEKVPGCFFFVGSANPEKGLNAGHHHPKFDFDEVVLPRAAALMAATVINLLSGM
jgi:amidohydrolase